MTEYSNKLHQRIEIMLNDFTSSNESDSESNKKQNKKTNKSMHNSSKKKRIKI